jgi:hypothetical protein
MTSRRHPLLLLVLCLAALGGGMAAAQQAARVQPIVAPRAVPAGDAMILTHFNPTAPNRGPCTGPGRVMRITEIGPESGWQAGPTAAGLAFHNPQGLALDANRMLYVADRDNRRLVRMEDVSGTGWRAFAGSGGNQLSPLGTQRGCNDSNHGVQDVAIDRAGRFYVAVANPWRIIRIDNFEGAGWITYPSSGRDEFSGRLVALDAQERIYIADNTNHRLMRMDDMSGRGLVTLGSFGNGVRQFNQPMGVDFDRQGRIYIGDEYNHRIVRVDDMTGAGWVSFGSYGSGIGQLSTPHEVSIDTLGRIHIADTGNNRYVRIDSMTGAGWVTFGNRELQGRDLEFSATKSLLVIGRGPVIPSLSLVPMVTVGSTQRTTLVAFSTGSDPVAATVAFTRPNDRRCGRPCEEPMSVTVDDVTASTFDRTIPPNGTMRLAASDAGEAVTGYARLRTTATVGGFALVQAMRGNTVTSEAAVPPFDPSDHFTFYIDNTNDARTVLVFDNPKPVGREPPPPPPCGSCEPGWTSSTARLRDRHGAVVATTTVGLAPGYQQIRSATQMFPAAGPGFEGTLEVESGESLLKIVAAAVRYEHGASDVFTLLPAVRHLEHPSRQGHLTGIALPVPTATTRDYPHIADGGSYRTEFVLVNPTNAATTATLQFFAADGAPLPLPIRGSSATSITVSLPARGVERVVTTGAAAEVSWGWARLTSPAAIDAIVVLQTVVDGAIRAEAPVWAASPAVRVRAFAENAAFTRSGIAVNNPNNNSVAATFLLRDAAGNVVASATRDLPARGYLAQFVTQLFPEFVEIDGTIDVETNGGPVGAVGIRYDNDGGTVFTLTPVVALP